MLILQKVREDLGIDRSELSRKSGVPLRTIEDLEKRGYGDIRTISKLASALDLSIDDIWVMESK